MRGVRGFLRTYDDASDYDEGENIARDREIARLQRRQETYANIRRNARETARVIKGNVTDSARKTIKTVAYGPAQYKGKVRQPRVSRGVRAIMGLRGSSGIIRYREMSPEQEVSLGALTVQEASENYIPVLRRMFFNNPSSDHVSLSEQLRQECLSTNIDMDDLLPNQNNIEIKKELI